MPRSVGVGSSWREYRCREYPVSARGSGRDYRISLLETATVSHPAALPPCFLNPFERCWYMWQADSLSQCPSSHLQVDHPSTSNPISAQNVCAIPPQRL